jgi:hypothetical protein
MVSIADLDAMSREQLLALARVRGVALPRRNISKPKLVEALRKAAIERKREWRRR